MQHYAAVRKVGFLQASWVYIIGFLRVRQNYNLGFFHLLEFTHFPGTKADITPMK